jgi:hypothetical protein
MPKFKVPVIYYGTFTIEAETSIEAELEAHNLDLSDAELDDTDYGDAYLINNKKEKKEEGDGPHS